MNTKNILLTLALAALCAAETFAAPIGAAFTYQGRLDDGGQPANNVYDLTFTLHDDPVNVASMGTYIILSAVPVTNGLFTVQLNVNGEFGGNAFNGQARWLQIGVRTNSPGNAFNNFTFLAPRQPLTPAPMALFAPNAGQAATANSANTATTAQTANSVAWANLSGLPGGFADGVDNDTTYTAGAGLSLSNGNQFALSFAGSGSANNVARSDHGHFGAQWAGASLSNGVSIFNSSANGTSLFGQQGGGSGQLLFFRPPAGVWGESSDGYGVHGATASSVGAGVYGLATGTAVTNWGVHGAIMSGWGAGVYGRNKNSSTNSNRASVQRAGVFGESQGLAGVAGLSDWDIGVRGVSSRSTGVYGYSESGNYGVYGSSSKTTGVGGTSDSGDGVFGYSDNGSGVHGFSYNGAGVRAMSATGNPIEAYQDGIVPTRRFYVSRFGEVYASGTFHAGGADFAEMLPAREGLEPADVLAIGEDGKLARSTQPYQHNVAGVHATKPGFLGGAHEGADLTGKVPLAVVGIVPVKVTSENGPIKPGDKLTTSSTAGHAMKADKYAEIGTVIGKALSALDGNRGIVQMLVILQ
jgi:hypothetical protein